jgi:hypothetical protein
MLKLTLRSKLWLYPGLGGWHFVTLPRNRAKEIKMHVGGIRRGWGSLPVTVTIGRTTWKTSIFPDSKSGSYVLPVKADVREKENLEAGDTVALKLEVMI